MSDARRGCVMCGLSTVGEPSVFLGDGGWYHLTCYEERPPHESTDPADDFGAAIREAMSIVHAAENPALVAAHRVLGEPEERAVERFIRRVESGEHKPTLTEQGLVLEIVAGRLRRDGLTDQLSEAIRQRDEARLTLARTQRVHHREFMQGECTNLGPNGELCEHCEAMVMEMFPDPPAARVQSPAATEKPT